jgi:hypothetical protein
MYVMATITRLSRGMSTPAMRAKLALHLLVLGVLAADHSDHPMAPDDLAVFAHLLYGSSDFHSLFKL